MDATIAGQVALRNEPVQARSTARLAALMDAAAAVVDEIGYERLTTAMVAERAGASIGTVYRYFPDRIAVLQALGARNLERALTRIADEAATAEHDDWVSALTASLEILIDAFRTEPGFRSLRVGDVIDLRPAPNEIPFKSVVAAALLDSLVARFDVPDNDDVRFAFETAIEISDALAARAFARNPDGDVSFLDAGGDIVASLLVPHFGMPTKG
ncbi:TetR family transcriptional regulator [Conyzicola nivalis]|uniref:TetR family transcriptional regulator n=1 Tax=Conyzicola nivalis TaxID=1477021 RepID=A0A916SG47_9MICO|nr:TetR/AcrR family transcriptional regulator [Conyzicola nivalis]GGA98367.1 TetR family transcriptional regulator [Conyzicola nivalis]